MELTLRAMIEDTLDGIKGWREMTTKDLASILEERVGDWLEEPIEEEEDEQ